MGTLEKMDDWPRRRTRLYWYDQYALNEQAAAFTRYDPDRIVDEIAGTGAEIVVVYAGNQWGIAYYPSEIWPQHPGLQGRDYVGDLTARFRARGMKVILYVNWLDSKHADWNVLPLGDEENPEHGEQPLARWADPEAPNGRVQDLPGGRWRFPCMNSPAREQVTSVTREIVERYRPDGFSLDMLLWTGICVCPRCRPILERLCETRELTRGAVAAHWNAYIDWASECSAAVVHDLTAILHESNVLAIHNAMFPLWMSSSFGVSERWLPEIDVYVSEIFSDLHAAGLSVRLHHALGKPSWMLRTSTQPHYAHWPISMAQWQLSAAACKANGCAVFGPCGIGARPDTTSSPRLLANVRAGLDLFAEDADLSEGAVSAARVGLVFSWATRRYHGQGALEWSEELSGWSQVLLEEHLPFDLIVAENVASADDMRQYDLVVLPNSAYVSDIFCGAIRDYVRGGGRLLATAETSLWSEQGARRADFGLADVLGVTHRGSADGDFAVGHEVDAEPVIGKLQLVSATGIVEERCMELDPAGSVAGMHDPLPLGPSAWPAVVRNHCGSGDTLYVAFDAGRFYRRFADEHAAAWLAQLVESLLPDRAFVAQAQRSLEIDLWRQESPRRLILHMAQRTQHPDDMSRVNEIVPVSSVVVRLPSPGPSARVTARHADLEVVARDGELVLHLSAIGAYAAVVIDY